MIINPELPNDNTCEQIRSMYKSDVTCEQLVTRGWALYDGSSGPITPIVEPEYLKRMNGRKPTRSNVSTHLLHVGETVDCGRDSKLTDGQHFLMLCPMDEYVLIHPKRILHDIGDCWFTADCITDFWPRMLKLLDTIRPHFRLFDAENDEYGPELMPCGILFKKTIRNINESWEPSVRQTAKLIAF